ncbi:MAG: hypothetical protein DYG85_16745 [Chloroflexi bacterium CFX1]|nr:hypothetical protein [Chloroflexi bacterium CFX1]
MTDVVKNSGLRGRGGAGFPTGVKWSFIDNKNWPHYVVANADESEPGTFKDREIMENNPFQFLEGLAIGCYAVGANAAYIYMRGEFWQVAAFLDEKIAEMEEAGYLGEKLFGKDYSLKIYTHLGAGAYICGEETAKHGNSRQRGREDLLAFGTRAQTGQLRTALRDDLPPVDLRTRHGRAGGAADQSHHAGGRVFVVDSGERKSVGHAAGLRRRPRARRRPGFRLGHCAGRYREHGLGRQSDDSILQA